MNQEFYEVKEVKCETCLGFGFVKVNMVNQERDAFNTECPDCLGHGHTIERVLTQEGQEIFKLCQELYERILKKSKKPNENTTEPTVSNRVSMPCVACAGSGKYSNGIINCAYCNGWGRIEVNHLDNIRNKAGQ